MDTRVQPAYDAEFSGGRHAAYEFCAILLFWSV